MSFLTAAFLLVVDISWRASCLILLVYALRPVLRAHLPARLVFAAWIAVTLRLLLPVALPAAWSPFNLTASLPGSSTRATPSLSLLPSVAPSPLSPDFPSSSSPSIFPSSPADSVSASPPLSVSPSPLPWLAALWALGAATLALARLVAWLRFTRRVRRGEPGPSLPDLATHSYPHPHSANERIRITITDAVRAPALHGIVHPRLLFPPGFLEGLTPHEFRLTVAHELAHARRRDLLVQGLLHLAAIVHWFNPLAWLVVRSARHDCELACDEAVLRRLPDTERSSYGAALMKIVTLAHGGITAPRFGLGVVETKQHLKRRIEMIITHPSFTRARTSLGAALLVGLTALSLTRELPAQSPTAAPEPASLSATAVPTPSPVPAPVATAPAVQTLSAAPAAPSPSPTAAALTTPTPAPSPTPVPTTVTIPAQTSGAAPAAAAPTASPSGAGTISLSNATFTSAVNTAKPVRTLNTPPTPELLAASNERLAALFPSGTVATVADQTITVADVKRELEPLLPTLQFDSSLRQPEDVPRKLSQLQDATIRDLIDRILVIKEFRRTPAAPGGEPRHIAQEAIDERIAEVLSNQFDNDRTKLIAYLRDRNLTMPAFRATIEDEMIYSYMKKRERNAAQAAKAAAAPRDPRGSAHLRLIMLKRAAGETDDALRERTKAVRDRFNRGEKFEALARELSEDSRRTRGGDWGWLYPSDLKPEFGDTFFALKKGEVSTPLVLPEGGFLLYSEDHR